MPSENVRYLPASAAASEELNAQAEGSMAVVHDLEAMVGGAERPAAVVAQAEVEEVEDAPARVVTLQKRPAAGKKATAEEQIPFGDTGTFGKF